MDRIPNSHPLYRQSGVTLMEVLIAMAISVTLLTAASMIFTRSNQQQVEIDKFNRLIDNGRYALDLLGNNLRLAGFYGEYQPDSPSSPTATALDDPCSTSVADIESALPFHVQGYDASAFNVSATRPSCIASTELKAGSDILVIRRVATSTTDLASVGTGGTARYLQATLCQYDTTKVKVATESSSMTLRQRDCTKISTTPYANPRQMVVELYFVAPNNTSGDGVPTLKKVELQADGTFSAAIPLVEGVEFMQVGYGVDNTTVDGAPDTYLACSSASPCTREQWASVVSVRVWLVARNIDSTSSWSDTRTYDLGLDGGWTYTPSGDDQKYRRQVFSRTVRLINPAERRES